MQKALVLLFMLVYLPLSGAVQPASAADCEFLLGFKTLYELIPDIVGECRGSQQYNPYNGDALQDTTGGLLVWRKADNFTAFTDGYRSWVNGPFGLQERLNQDRFEWEEQIAPCDISVSDVAFNEFIVDGNGTATSRGTIYNACERQFNLVVDIFASSREGLVIMDGESIFIRDLSPGETRTLTASVPNAISATWFSWKITDVSPSRQDPSCPDGETCFSLDPWLVSAVSELRRLTDGEWLMQMAEQESVQIIRGRTPEGVFGLYNSRTKTITISSDLDTYSSWVRAAILSHELQHAADDAAGQLAETSAGCYAAEDSAFRRMAQVWRDLWQDRLPLIGDVLHWELNEVATVVERDPNRFTASLVERYKRQCGQRDT